MYQNVSKCIKCVKMYQHVSKCIKMYKNVSKCINMYKNVSKCIKIYQDVLKQIPDIPAKENLSQNSLPKMR